MRKLHVYLSAVKRHTFARVIHNPKMDTFGDRLRKLRLGRKLSQESLAKLIGIKQGSLTQLETGKSKGPSSKTLTKLARIFDIDPEWLMTGKGAQQPVSALEGSEAELIAAYRQLSPEGQEYILSRTKVLQEDEQQRKLYTRRLTDRPPPRKPEDGH